ncbi:MAG TPA: ABC transporter permease [Puia sp.]|uniref:ABC transporter permease n=1 Tax=Puia sp. TaxID=2045100 RepID=UPI002CF1F015|nr:ABC transporter permease [Puia sp.]HVU95015.1 ABC transporter permease [Puia sp.]
MIKNYLKIAWRTLLRQKTYTAINIIGLTLGISAALLIFTLVSYQLSFDDFHPGRQRIYRIGTDLNSETLAHLACAPQPLGKAFRNDYNYAEKTARIVYYRNTLVSLPNEKEIKKFEEDEGVAFTEPAFFDIFNFPLAQGDRKTALQNPHSALITTSIAKKYFGSDAPNAIGKTIRVNNDIDFTITGILQPLPPNTDRKQEIYLSYDNLKDWNRSYASDSSWGALYSGSNCFVLLRPGVNPATVDKALVGMAKKYLDAEGAAATSYHLQPLQDIHTNTKIDGTFDKKYSWTLLIIATFLLATACMNFINMATAQALNRGKEVGIRKVMGSLRNQLFWQFIAETALITLAAGILAWGVAILALPSLNQLTFSKMSLQLFSTWRMMAFFFGIIILLVFAAGSYPGLVLARFEPVLALKSKLSQAHIGGLSLRRLLVVVQFSISQMLIITMIIIAWQMHYSMNLDMGFNKDAIVTIPIPTRDNIKMHTLRTRLALIPGVESLSFCMQPPASRRNQNTDIQFDNRPKTERWDINIKPADDQYVPTFGLQLVAGRNLFPSDTVREYLVNETTVWKLGLNSPLEALGKMININDNKAPIVGVIKDFHAYSLKNDIAPVAITSASANYQGCSLKINPRQLPQVLASIEPIWNNTYPDYLYSYTFLDERIADFYFIDTILLKLVEVFSGIAIFISCLGLYGLVSFMAVRRTKEIGVRKVLGASIAQIGWLFGQEFLRLILIAFAIAAPIAWMAAHNYLKDFKYKITVGPQLFLIGLAVTILIAAVAVGYRSLRAATANPVRSLRSE